MINDSNLTKLKTGLLFLDFDQINKEPEYEAMGRQTKKHSVISKRYQYAQDLERSFIEAKLTSKLLLEVDNLINVDEKIFEPEEIISYYDGIFLEYIHQIKDKLFRLIWWIIQKDDVKNKIEEPDSINLGNFKSYKDILLVIGIKKYLEDWNQGLSSGIATALRKRTQHHHFISRLQLNEDFQKIRMSKSMLSSASIGYLSEYGKNKMKQIGEESYKKWRDDVINKQKNTLDQIESNLENVSKKLIEFYKFPIEPKKQAEIFNTYAEQQKKFDIENSTSLAKIDGAIKGLIDTFILHTKSFFKEQLVSIYLVGSVPRGEFVLGSSDINIVIITNSDAFDSFPSRMDPLIKVRFFSENSFLSENNKKWRFICWSDGLLIEGKQFKFKKDDFPKPGTFLTLLLNSNTIDELEELKHKVANLKSPSRKIMRFFCLEAVKLMLDFGFGVAMANKPFYSSSRKVKIEYVKKMFPSALRQTKTFEIIYKGATVNQKDYVFMLDTFLKNARKNYTKLSEVAQSAVEG
ncbi:TPA: hypothetical protein DD455_03295 [Candidatus Shapirobacteria bacterium]|nr:hypothetical protein [Candidatus Shapirobacteria bacterium]